MTVVEFVSIVGYSNYQNQPPNNSCQKIFFDYKKYFIFLFSHKKVMKNCLDFDQFQECFNNEVVIKAVEAAGPWLQNHTTGKAKYVYQNYRNWSKNSQ